MRRRWQSEPGGRIRTCKGDRRTCRWEEGSQMAGCLPQRWRERGEECEELKDTQLLDWGHG